MRNVFWIGVYPGLTEPMLDHIADAFSVFMRELQDVVGCASEPAV